ncbi:EVE domain-containing protein [Mycetocola tolaasinivorans]|uniref:EVE domain-containing protein n=1 Tax=Mycetocola tolaasinivorans TaxID=76635 RepID=UPI0016027B7D|nr:EVE domain-containing protein [Mycetocola tolaasinivorans]
MAIRYWLGVVTGQQAAWCKHHGVFAVSPGLRRELADLGEADGLVLYSPRARPADEEPLRAFTAIGRLTAADVRRVDTTTPPGERLRPWQRAVLWEPDADTVPLRVLRDVLDLSAGWDWAKPLRRGLIEISAHDFRILRAEMGPPLPDERPRGIAAAGPGADETTIAPGAGLLRWQEDHEGEPAGTPGGALPRWSTDPE